MYTCMYMIQMYCMTSNMIYVHMHVHVHDTNVMYYDIHTCTHACTCT